MLAISSYLVPFGDKVGGWLPLCSGIADLSSLATMPVLSGVLGVIFNVLIIVSLLAVNTKSVHNAFNPNFTVSFFLMVLLMQPGAVYFSQVQLAVLLFVWGQYSFIAGKKFTPMFLLSCSALCYAPLVWTLPLVWIISIFGAQDIPRVAVKSLGGILLPPLYLIAFRYLVFHDTLDFVETFMHHAADFANPFHDMDYPDMFLAICIIAVTLHAISYIVANLYKNSIVTEHLLKMELMSVVLGFVVVLLFGGNQDVPASMLVALPVSMILSYYFTKNITTATARGELFMLCCAAVIARISCFV